VSRSGALVRPQEEVEVKAAPDGTLEVEVTRVSRAPADTPDPAPATVRSPLTGPMIYIQWRRGVSDEAKKRSDHIHAAFVSQTLAFTISQAYIDDPANFHPVAHR